MFLRSEKIFQRRRKRMTVNCIICDGEVRLPQDAMEGELMVCPDCGTELELVCMDPLTVEEAPEVQEDWGE